MAMKKENEGYTELYDLIREGNCSVFDIPFVIRTENLIMYLLERYKVMCDREKLDEFLEKALEDVKNAPNTKFAKDLLEQISPYLPGGKREFYPEFGQLCDRVKEGK